LSAQALRQCSSHPHQGDHHQGLLTQPIRYAHTPGERDSQEVVKYYNMADTKLNAC